MKKTHQEIQKLVKQVKAAQEQFQKLVRKRVFIDEARRYAERQKKDAKKLFGRDIDKVKAFLQKEKQELIKLQKDLPREGKKLKQFVDTQKKEFERLLKGLGSLPKDTQKAVSKKSSRKKTARKKNARKKTSRRQVSKKKR